MSDLGSVKRLTPEQLKPGMIIALDVLCKQGSVVTKANTFVSRRVVNKIALSGADTVYIYIKPSREAKELIINSDIDARRNLLQNSVEEIIETGNVPQEELSEMVADAITVAESTGNVHQYMHLLRERSEYTFAHSISVGIMSSLYAKWMGLTKAETDDLIVASGLHDIGKLSIDLDLLDKPGKLTNDEYSAVKMHVNHGSELLEICKVPERIILAVSEHHERADGSGYPAGKNREQISELGSMLAVLDVYDALVSNRVYRDALSPFQALEIMQRDRFGHFRFGILDVFISNLAFSCMGKRVSLSNGKRGVIVFINPFSLLRPYIKLDGGEIIDLYSYPQIQITSVDLT